MNLSRSILLVILLFTCALSSAQVNLVLNPSLEQHGSCPHVFDQIKYANHWMSLDSMWVYPAAPGAFGVPEYCHICDFGGQFGVPSSSLHIYTHYPHSGVGMAEMQMFSSDPDAVINQKRDYLQGHLSGTLTAGQSYCVLFFTTLCQASQFKINQIGAYLDDGTIDTTHFPGMPQTHIVPQVVETTIIADTLNWVKVEGSFIANGTERLITIGNFFDLAHTAYTPSSGGGFSWYLVDDISVMRSDAIAKAGPDRIITSSHDTVMVGDTLDSYLPTYWYAGGRLVDSNKGGFMIHVDTTTTFVVSLDVCGHVTYDTMTVAVSTEMSAQGPNLNNVTVFPNPTSTELTIEHADTTTAVDMTYGVVMADDTLADTVVMNYYRFYRIYLRYMAVSMSFSDSCELAAIAALCPVREGAAVYKARGLYRVVFNDPGDFSDNCEDTSSAVPCDTCDWTGRHAPGGGTRLVPAYVQRYKMYPNPNEGSFTVQQQLDDKDPVSAEVIDAVGRTVYKEQRMFESKKMQLQLDNVAPGLYMLRLTDRHGQVHNFKFVVTKQ